MDSLRSPTSPRLRPGGPRTLTRRQTSNISTLPFALDPPTSEEASPSYSVQQSPALSSQAGSLPSPGVADFEQLPAPLSIKSQVRDTREWQEEGFHTAEVEEDTDPNEGTSENDTFTRVCLNTEDGTLRS